MYELVVPMRRAATHKSPVLPGTKWILWYEMNDEEIQRNNKYKKPIRSTFYYYEYQAQHKRMGKFDMH